MEILILVLLYYLSQNPAFAESVKPLMGKIKDSEQMLNFLNDLSKFSGAFGGFSCNSATQTTGGTDKKSECQADGKTEQGGCTDGEAHSASSVSNTVSIGADGVTGEWNYVNNTTSGNAVVLSITVDGEAIYTSELLQPGESIEGFVLETPLAAGSYVAMAVTSIYDEAGERLFSSSVPVTLNVAG